MNNFKPTKESILEEMELYNNDEIGINNTIDYDEAEYNLLLSDKYHNRTNESVYLEYVNDWLTVAKMAEYYQISIKELSEIIDKGRSDNWYPHKKMIRLVFRFIG